jgi:hypothetical protein
MKYRIIIIFLCILSYGCEQSQLDKSLEKKIPIEKKFKNIGFALIYDENENNIRNFDHRSLNIYHKSLKRKSMVKITNPNNGKSLIAEVKSNRIKFSEFYNSIITKRIVEDLNLDSKDPYVEIVLISKNSTFVAKKSKTFEEEKKVAEKAPIDGIQIKDLNEVEKKKKKNKSQSFSYSIKVADFYYKDTAEMMLSRLEEETSLKNYRIIKLSKTKYRVLIGPFNDIKSIKESFEKMKSFNFENLEILKNV